jgi:hypothetical protein
VEFVLSDAEREALLWALDNYLPELRYEAARVKVERYRHDIVVKEEILSALHERLARQAGRQPGASGVPA